MFDISELQSENKVLWFRRMKKDDPLHARLFCRFCISYIGAFGKCNCEAANQGEK